ncbi:hypothetical protein B0T24DRAFT_377685 [Lasiosphaeria ovina]|uniref:Uncharacterized protein n=1 Tax=Lasiosphaeria ovina TaxID=92902 RepID=A0AAE0JZ28_9PEZI|nr:hypothetical protein B0T24DRAFT_377685 [Lasiosphaeria ovina]
MTSCWRPKVLGRPRKPKPYLKISAVGAPFQSGFALAASSPFSFLATLPHPEMLSSGRHSAISDHQRPSLADPKRLVCLVFGMSVYVGGRRARSIEDVRLIEGSGISTLLKKTKLSLHGSFHGMVEWQTWKKFQRFRAEGMVFSDRPWQFCSELILHLRYKYACGQ